MWPALVVEREVARHYAPCDLGETPLAHVARTDPLPAQNYRDGTTYVLFEPLDFISRLASLVPHPRIHLTRFHGVFAPNHRSRAHLTRMTRITQPMSSEERTPAGSRAAAWDGNRERRMHPSVVAIVCVSEASGNHAKSPPDSYKLQVPTASPTEL